MVGAGSGRRPVRHSSARAGGETDPGHQQHHDEAACTYSDPTLPSRPADGCVPAYAQAFSPVASSQAASARAVPRTRANRRECMDRIGEDVERNPALHGCREVADHNVGAGEDLVEGQNLDPGEVRIQTPDSLSTFTILLGGVVSRMREAQS